MPPTAAKLSAMPPHPVSARPSGAPTANAAADAR